MKKTFVILWIIFLLTILCFMTWLLINFKPVHTINCDKAHHVFGYNYGMYAISAEYGINGAATKYKNNVISVVKNEPTCFPPTFVEAVGGN